MSSVRSCNEINDKLDALCDCGKHTIQHRTSSSASVDSVSIIVGVDLVYEARPAKFRAGISTRFLLYDLRADMLLDNLIWLFDSR